MNILEGIEQGSEQWRSARTRHFCASDAPAMLGLSRYTSRNDLLHRKATGAEAEPDAATQARYDRGHAAEAAARPQVEAFLQYDLYPVTAVAEVDGLPLLASLDGVTIDEAVIWENKLANAENVEQLRGGIVDDTYWPQLEQQLLVTGAKRAYFTVSDADGAVLAALWYESVPERRARVVIGWKQLSADLAAYTPPEVIPAAVAAPQMGLPAVAITVTGGIAIRDNMAVFGNALAAYCERINRKPETDQDFADLEATVKTLKAAEDALDAAENNALAQTGDLDSLRRTVGQYRDLARQHRLIVEKLVKAEKENRRNAIMQGGINALREHIDALNKRLGKPYMPDMAWADFQGAVRGLKTIASLQNAVSTELANAKLEASGMADRIEINLKDFAISGDYGFLFPDMAQLVTKPSDDFANAVTARINEHKQRENERMEAERARIRQEEEAKAEAKLRAEQQAVAPEPLLPVTEHPHSGPEQLPLAQGAGKPTLRLGQINERLAPISLTVEGLASMGFAPVAVDKNAKLYHGHDFPRICDALVRHIQAISGKKT